MNTEFKIYKKILVQALKEISDKDYQKRIWLNTGDSPIMTISFSEAANNIFDDALVTDALENNQIIFDKNVTQALRELDKAVDAVDEYRDEEEIIDDPLMEIVRQKAAKALELIQSSNGSESTVEVIN
jgi:DNA-directed RNA polymerase subunit K/omega